MLFKKKNSTQKHEYQYLHKKDEEIKCDNITVENEGIIEYGTDFVKCKIIHNRGSTRMLFNFGEYESNF